MYDGSPSAVLYASKHDLTRVCTTWYMTGYDDETTSEGNANLDEQYIPGLSRSSRKSCRLSWAEARGQEALLRGSPVC